MKDEDNDFGKAVEEGESKELSPEAALDLAKTTATSPRQNLLKKFKSPVWCCDLRFSTIASTSADGSRDESTPAEEAIQRSRLAKEFSVRFRRCDNDERDRSMARKTEEGFAPVLFTKAKESFSV